MKRLLASILLITLVLIAAGCSSAQTPNKTPAGASVGADTAPGTDAMDINNRPIGEVQYYPAFDPDYKTATNDVSGFWFDIPTKWRAINEKASGEVFKIDPGNENVSLSVYGTVKNGDEDDYCSELAGTSGKVEDFTFRDGWLGKKVTNGTKLYYLRTDGDTYIIFSADFKGDPDWFAKNRDTLEYVGGSLRTSQESFGNLGGDNKITLDDLKLGDIRLDTPYDKLVEIMGTKPDKEEADAEVNGAETLFFKDGTQIYMVDDAVYSVNVISSDYPTPKGLKVGDTAERLKELYGDPDNVDDTHWGYNYDGYEVLSVVIEDDKVTQIQIDHVM